jgi:hypothetical protein
LNFKLFFFGFSSSFFFEEKWKKKFEKSLVDPKLGYYSYPSLQRKVLKKILHSKHVKKENDRDFLKEINKESIFLKMK